MNSNLSYLARNIRDLTYKEMIELAEGLYNLSMDVSLEDEKGWADIMSAWSESRLELDAEEEQEQAQKKYDRQS